MLSLGAEQWKQSGSIVEAPQVFWNNFFFVRNPPGIKKITHKNCTAENFLKLQLKPNKKLKFQLTSKRPTWSARSLILHSSNYSCCVQPAERCCQCASASPTIFWRWFSTGVVVTWRNVSSTESHKFVVRNVCEFIDCKLVGRISIFVFTVVSVHFVITIDESFLHFFNAVRSAKANFKFALIFWNLNMMKFEIQNENNLRLTKYFENSAFSSSGVKSQSAMATNTKTIADDNTHFIFSNYLEANS